MVLDFNRPLFGVFEFLARIRGHLLDATQFLHWFISSGIPIMAPATLFLQEARHNCLEEHPVGTKKGCI